MLLENKIKFSDKDGKQLYLKTFEYFSNDRNYTSNNYYYYFFDIDGDDEPELCIWNTNLYVFKYDKTADKIILWHSTGCCCSINGSLKIRQELAHIESMNLFLELNQRGDEQYSVAFFSMENEHKNINKAEGIFMVSLPQYAVKNNQVKITEQMKNQAYYNKDEKRYYFNVTSSQYAQLTDNYFKAKDLADKNIEKVQFTYKELFG